MKKFLVTSILLLGMLIVVGGCDDNNETLDPVPEPPQGVYTVTGDSEVYIWWAGPYDNDIAEFIIYRNDQGPDAPYVEIATRVAEPNPNLDLIFYSDTDRTVQNGTTYWYAVASVDNAGQISELSAENVFDTPRPEGVVSLFDVAENPQVSGFSFAGKVPVSATTSASDVYVDRFEDVFYLNAGYLIFPDTLAFRGYIQDVGYTENFDDIGWSPQNGWSQLNFVEIIQGHTYTILTEDNHYAKMWVTGINTSSGRVDFRWAYQEDEGNPELVAPNQPSEPRQKISKAKALQ